MLTILHAAWPNLIDVRLGRDGDGQSKGFAFLVREFAVCSTKRSVVYMKPRGIPEVPTDGSDRSCPALESCWESSIAKLLRCAIGLMCGTLSA